MRTVIKRCIISMCLTQRESDCARARARERERVMTHTYTYKSAHLHIVHVCRMCVDLYLQVCVVCVCVCVCVDVLTPGLRLFACVSKGKRCRRGCPVRGRGRTPPARGLVPGFLLLVRLETAWRDSGGGRSLRADILVEHDRCMSRHAQASE